MLGCALLLAALAAPPAEAGTFPVRPVGDQANIPDRYRLAAADPAYTLTHARTLPVCGVRMDRLTFPSPVASPHECNNTVHAEYYRPTSGGRGPGVVILDITGGDQSLSRMIGRHLAMNGINALFVQMAYYGPRRPAEGKVRLLSTNIPRTMDAVRQTVMDCRTAAAWLAQRPEVDPDRIGILGTSLGSFVAGLTAETEPRFGRVVLLLGGGGLVDAYYGHPQAKPYVRVWELMGGSKERVKELLAPVDPLTRADLLQGRTVLMVAAKRDEIVPPTMALALHRAAGGTPRLLWYDTTHYGAALFIVPMLRPVVETLGGP